MILQLLMKKKDSQGRNLFAVPFIQKYLLYAKTTVEPILTDEAIVTIVDAFEDLRSRDDTKTLPVTPRMLETMIRLSCAHAKCRLSSDVQGCDIEVALQIMKYALYHDADTKSLTRMLIDPKDEIAKDQETKKDNLERVSTNSTQSKKRKRDQVEFTESQDEPPKKKTSDNLETTTTGKLDPKRVQCYKEALNAVRQEQHEDMFPRADVPKN